MFGLMINNVILYKIFNISKDFYCEKKLKALFIKVIRDNQEVGHQISSYC